MEKISDNPEGFSELIKSLLGFKKDEAERVDDNKASAKGGGEGKNMTTREKSRISVQLSVPLK